jgi:hypothetical protein
MRAAGPALPELSLAAQFSMGMRIGFPFDRDFSAFGC